MKSDSGFYKRRRGILEHLENGRIGLIDLAVHDFLNLKANLVINPSCSIPPGICFSSSVAIHALCPKEITERTIRRSLQHLERIGWIKRWPTRGKRGNYPILVCRASVHDLSAVEYRVNGTETTDWRHPVLIPAALRPHSGPDLSGDREQRIESREKSKPAAKPARPADPRYQPFVDFAFETYRAKHGRPPIWQGKDFSSLSRLLKSQSDASLPFTRLESLWRNYSASTEPFTVKQGDSLFYFCSNLDKFSDGPILGRKEKLNATDAIRLSLNNSGLDENGRLKRPN